MYTFENTCKENKDLVLNDRTCKLFFIPKQNEAVFPKISGDCLLTLRMVLYGIN